MVIEKRIRCELCTSPLPLMVRLPSIEPSWSITPEGNPETPLVSTDILPSRDMWYAPLLTEVLARVMICCGLLPCSTSAVPPQALTARPDQAGGGEPGQMAHGGC